MAIPPSSPNRIDPHRFDPYRFDVVIVGSGFAGTILARVLASAGRSVLVVERGRHPRFALGESSTPLAAIALERLARRPELGPSGGADLHALAAAGRWARDLDPRPGEAVEEGRDDGGRRLLRRGRKRGFTFYRHRPGRPYANSAANEARLLVAASPDDALADNHWLRADVDHHLARRAVAAGAVLWEGCELDRVELAEDGGPVRLSGRIRVDAPPVKGSGGAAPGRPAATSPDPSPADGPGPSTPAVAPAAAAPSAGAADRPVPGERFAVEAGFVVDASGPGGFLARHLPIAAAGPGTPDTTLLYGHFRGVRPFAVAARAAGAVLEPGPYPDDLAAVHHFLDEGWMYTLRFAPEARDGRDEGALTSAGFVLRRGAADALADRSPEAAFAALLERHPTLAATFRDASPVRPVARVDRLPHRLSRAVGRRWLLLPHAYAFFDPLFSTGMAWSLVGVERVADLLLGAEPGAPPDPRRLAAYETLLATEADHVADLVAGAWLAMEDFRTAAAHAQLYFTAASFQEAKQRLTDGDHPWDGFLGATDPHLGPLFRAARRRLEAAGPAVAPAAFGTAFESWMAEAIAPRNLAGLADPARRNLYPVDLEVLVERGHLLGLSRQEVRAALPRLRSL